MPSFTEVNVVYFDLSIVPVSVVLGDRLSSLPQAVKNSATTAKEIVCMIFLFIVVYILS